MRSLLARLSLFSGAFVVVLTGRESAAAARTLVFAGSIYCQPPVAHVGEVPGANVFALAEPPSNALDVHNGVFAAPDGHYEIRVHYYAVNDGYIDFDYFVNGILQPTSAQPFFLPAVPSDTYYLYRTIIRADCSAIQQVNPFSLPPEDSGLASKQESWIAGAAATGGGGVLGVLLAVLGAAGVAAAGPPPPHVIATFPIDSVTLHSNGGGLLADARTLQFTSVGFRYASARDTTEAIVTNPSASAFAEGWRLRISGTGLIGGQPFRLHVGGSYTAEDGLAFGMAYYLQKNDDFRTVSYDDGATLSQKLSAVDHAVVAFAAKRLTPTVAVSVAFNAQLQHRAEPDYVQRLQSDANGTTDEVVTRQEVSTTGDVALGLTIQACPSLRIGLSGQNILGSREVFKGVATRDRVAGGGISWFHGRLHVGADLEYSEISKANASFGASYIVSPNWELGGGYLTTERSVRLRLRFKSVDASIRHSDGGWSEYFGLKARF
jgi:hypothetical protein